MKQTLFPLQSKILSFWYHIKCLVKIILLRHNRYYGIKELKEIQRKFFECYKETLVRYSIDKYKQRSKFSYNEGVIVSKSNVHVVKNRLYEDVYSDL